MTIAQLVLAQLAQDALNRRRAARVNAPATAPPTRHEAAPPASDWTETEETLPTVDE